MGMIVACAAYENGRRIADIDLAESGRFVASPDRFVWIGLHEPDANVLSTVQEQFGLHPLAVEDALHAHQRPKLDIFGQSLFMVLRTVQLLGGQAEFGETHIFAGKGYVISVRHGPSSSYARVRARCESEPELLRNGEDFVLYAIMDFVVDNYLEIVEVVEDEVEKFEDIANTGIPHRELIDRIARLRRELLRLRRSTAPLVEVCNRMQRLVIPFIDDEMKPYFADVADHVLRVNESIDLQRDILKTSFETCLLLASNRQNEVMRQLAAWAAILAVPTAITGIYGMNFEHMPELKVVWGYPAVLGFVILTCGALFAWFNRIGWL